MSQKENTVGLLQGPITQTVWKPGLTSAIMIQCFATYDYGCQVCLSLYAILNSILSINIVLFI